MHFQLAFFELQDYVNNNHRTPSTAILIDPSIWEMLHQMMTLLEQHLYTAALIVVNKPNATDDPAVAQNKQKVISVLKSKLPEMITNLLKEIPTYKFIMGPRV